LVAAWLLGWVALGYEVGSRIAEAVNMVWAPAISAGVGTFILIFVLGGFSKLIPCIGWLPQTLVGLWGLGAVLLTRFGTQDYPTEMQKVAVEEPEQLPEDVPEVKDEVVENLPLEEESIPDDGLSPDSESQSGDE
jgi:hypothetical protein